MRLALINLVVFFAMQVFTSQVSMANQPPSYGGASLKPMVFEALPAWGADDHAAAFTTFRRTCGPVTKNDPTQQQGLEKVLAPSSDLRAVCAAALQLPVTIDAAAARRFFEQHFRPYQVIPNEGEGFLTGYYEPEFQGRLKPDNVFDTPLLALPKEAIKPFPDRAAIEDGALQHKTSALIYLERVDAFMAHVQGSVRVRLEDGTARRFAYAGRNGHAYTSVARLIVEQTGIAPKDLTAPKLVAWLRAHQQEAKRLMRENRSYIFFRQADELRSDRGPVGASHIQLEAGRSIAIDRTIWPYGLPFWIEAMLPHCDGERAFQKLVVAQDTGSAILGPARADIFTGSGKSAGEEAGVIRHVPERFIVLLPVSSEVSGP